MRGGSRSGGSAGDRCQPDHHISAPHLAFRMVDDLDSAAYGRILGPQATHQQTDKQPSPTKDWFPPGRGEGLPRTGLGPQRWVPGHGWFDSGHWKYPKQHYSCFARVTKVFSLPLKKIGKLFSAHVLSAIRTSADEAPRFAAGGRVPVNRRGAGARPGSHAGSRFE